jgi:hypothetical protein
VPEKGEPGARALPAGGRVLLSEAAASLLRLHYGVHSVGVARLDGSAPLGDDDHAHDHDERAAAAAAASAVAASVVSTFAAAASAAAGRKLGAPPRVAAGASAAPARQPAVEPAAARARLAERTPQSAWARASSVAHAAALGRASAAARVALAAEAAEAAERWHLLLEAAPQGMTRDSATGSWLADNVPLVDDALRPPPTLDTLLVGLDRCVVDARIARVSDGGRWYPPPSAGSASEQATPDVVARTSSGSATTAPTDRLSARRGQPQRRGFEMRL